MALYVGGTSLLLHGDGADGSTVFADETGKTVTAYGNARISTAQSKFGGSSMYFDGSGDYLTVPGSDFDFDFGVGDFTIEAWVYTASVVSENRVILNRRASGSSGIGYVFYINENMSFLTFGYSADGVNTTTVIGDISTPLSTWTHVSVSRKNQSLLLFVNGVICSSTSITGALHAPVTASSIGANQYDGSRPWHGHIDDLRIVKGVALYTAAFTPPATPLDVIGPIYVQIQPLTPYGPPLAKYNPAIGKPVMQAITTDLTDRLPYGTPAVPLVNNVNPWEFKGRGRITGTVKNTPATPVYRLLRLYREPGGLLVKSIWSDPATGAYTFDGIPLGYRYTVISYDHTETFRAVIADRVLPEVIA